MNATNQRICAWAGPVAAIIWLIGPLFLGVTSTDAKSHWLLTSA
jgi:hypothetical protein